MKRDYIFSRIIKSILISVMLTGLCTSCILYGQNYQPGLPKEKQTTAGLYVTAREAYDMWKMDTSNIIILDVRTAEEWLFVGHAPMAWNIPVLLQTFNWDPEKNRYAMKSNPGFISQVKEIFKTTDTILVTCRSGARSAMAVNQLFAAGYKNVYNITDGMEGDLVEEPGSVFYGQHVKNGWKNSGLPWTYEVARVKMSLPKIKD